MFELLKKELATNSEQRREKITGAINAGDENYLKHYSTDHSLEQYDAGEITEDELKKRAIRRIDQGIKKHLEQDLAKLDAAEAAKAPDYIRVSVSYSRSVNGWNPHAAVWGTDYHTGAAYGGNYDKESAAVADALNQDAGIMRILYELKEAGLAAGKSDRSTTAYTGVDNREVLGYGAGYWVLPDFEGGVGVQSFWNILALAGYHLTEYHGKHDDGYTLERRPEK